MQIAREESYIEYKALRNYEKEEGLTEGSMTNAEEVLSKEEISYYSKLKKYEGQDLTKQKNEKDKAVIEY